MAVCEYCWGEAQQRASLCGGSVVDRYREVLDEAEAFRDGAHVEPPWHPKRSEEASVTEKG